MDWGAISFVVRSFEYKWNSKQVANKFVVARTVQSKVQVFQDIYASQQDEGAVVGKRDGSQLYLTAHGLDLISDFWSLLALIDLSAYLNFYGFFYSSVE